MILSFGDPTTADLYHALATSRVRRVPPTLARRALRKLDMLNAATTLQDLRALPGNRLEALRGGLDGFHSIRVNRQWRIVFRWTELGPAHVSLVDYH